MKQQMVFVMMCALLGVTFSSGLTEARASPETTLYIDPPSVIDPTLTPGSSFTVGLMVSDVEFLYAWQANVSFDPTVLHVSQLIEGDFLASQPEGTFGAERIENAEGWALFAWSTIGPYLGVSGSGTLATIEFQVLAVGESVIDIVTDPIYNPYTGEWEYMTRITQQLSPLPPPLFQDLCPPELVGQDGYFSNLGAVPVGVLVDVKPGSWPNSIKTKSRGVLPVCICGTENFDVMTVDPATVRLHSEDVEEGVAPLRWSWEDVATPYTADMGGGHGLEGDGILDLVFHFGTREAAMTLTLTDHLRETLPLMLRGNLKEEYDGTPICGDDTVRIL